MIAPPKPPPHDELEALIKEARERQLRRRLLGTAGVAIVAALGLTISALTIGGNQSAKSAARTGPAGVPFCRSSQLSATAGFVGATGSMLGGATITNSSRTACSLPTGMPIVTVSLRGTPMPVQTRMHNPQGWPSWKAARVLQPGARSEVLMQWWNYCGPGAGQLMRPIFELRIAQLVVHATADETRPPFCNAPGGHSTLYVSRLLIPS
jgi:hypothetical protein